MQLTLLFGIFGIVGSNNCGKPVELMIVHDMTTFWRGVAGSEEPLYLTPYSSITASVLDDVMTELATTNPGSKMGLITFKDKPIDPMGEAEDYCARLEVPLNESAASTVEYLADEIQTGGSDLPDANYYGLLYAAQHPKAGWTPLEGLEGRKRPVRVAIQISNTYGHWGREGLGCGSDPECPTAPHPGHYQEDEDKDCREYLYPETPDIVRAMEGEEVKLGLLLVLPGYHTASEEQALKIWTYVFGQFQGGAENMDSLIQLRLIGEDSDTPLPTAGDDLKAGIFRILDRHLGIACEGIPDETTEETTWSTSTAVDEPNTPSTEDISTASLLNTAVASSSVTETLSIPSASGSAPSQSMSTSGIGGGTTRSIAIYTSLETESAPIGLIVGITVAGVAGVGLIAGGITKWGMRPRRNDPPFEELQEDFS